MLDNSINKNISNNFYSANNYNYYDEIKANRDNILKELRELDKETKFLNNSQRNNSRYSTFNNTNFKNNTSNDKLDIDFDKIKKLSSEKSKGEDKANKTLTNKSELSEEDQKVVEKLKARDAEVKAHEQAHVAAGGGLITGGPTYSYQSGPDGQQYAIGGEVQIDSSTEPTPEETISKMQQVRRAALAPAEPSSQDIQVASNASRLEMQARMELSQSKNEDPKSNNTKEDTNSKKQNKSENKNLLEIYFKNNSQPKFNFSF